jgi:hypothetical protein
MACFTGGSGTGWINPKTHNAIAKTGIKIYAEALFDLKKDTNIVSVLKISVKMIAF